MGILPKEKTLAVNASKQSQVKEALLEDFNNTNLVYFGGTIEVQDIIRLKKILFRATRGKAILTTFPIEVAETDKIRKDDFHLKNEGYYVLVQDTGSLVEVVQRVCQSFSVRDDIQKVF
jgi:hypothetical protein